MERHPRVTLSGGINREASGGINRKINEEAGGGINREINRKSSAKFSIGEPLSAAGYLRRRCFVIY